MSTLPALEPSPSAPLPTPVLTRRAAGRIVGGVAGGTADHLGVDVFRVRVVFAVLCAAAGAGIAAYGLLWVFTSAGDDVRRPDRAERRRAYGLLVLGIGGAVALGSGLSGNSSTIVAPVVVVAIGATLVWREFDSAGAHSAGSPRPRSARTSVLGWARIVSGVTLVVIGLCVVVVARVDVQALRSSLLAVVVTLVGAILLTVPLWMRLWRALGEERSARIRNDEREDIASHLHDSVLQTLALIQKQSTDSAEVLRLARSQERELRKWLFGGSETDHASLVRALATIAGEVEDHYGVTVDPVTVGDVELDQPSERSGITREVSTALLGATREALVNAAKHSGVMSIDLYVEAGCDAVDVFVRDRGCGFDPDVVSDDRQGLARSVRARIERRGGAVNIRSAPGKGSEIHIRVPRDTGTTRHDREERSA
ncbi:histidine kinase [Rhodococcus sp. MEB064]|nr:PspC domain-containing protein [Rhodococcus sp. MEB064]KIQ19493.1 histidine kinase [Rhodococcus sp. MEB064]